MMVIESQITLMLAIVGVASPVLLGTGLFMIKSLNDLCKRIATLEGRHIEEDSKEY